MKKILLIFVFIFCGCSKQILTCYKKDFSIYGENIIYEIYNFKDEKFINYNNIKKIVFNKELKNYIDIVYNYYIEENKLIDSIFDKKITSINKYEDYIKIVIDVDVDNNIKKLNLNENFTIDYLNKNLIEKGYICEIES